MKQKKKQEEEPLVGFEEIKKLTGMSVPFLRKAQYKYDLPHYKLGNRIRFKMSEVLTWLEQRHAG